MLNTSLHNPNVRDRPPFERFVSMNRGINDGSDLPEEQLRVRGLRPHQLSPQASRRSLSLGPWPKRGSSELEHSKRGLYRDRPPFLAAVLRGTITREVDPETGLPKWPHLKKEVSGVPFVAQRVKNPTSILEDGDLIPSLTQWVKDPALPGTAV